MEQEVLLIGTGRMARQFARVLIALGRKPIVVGRSEEGAWKFSAETGITAVHGGAEVWRKSATRVPSHVIVAVNPEELSRVTKECIRA